MTAAYIARRARPRDLMARIECRWLRWHYRAEARPRDPDAYRRADFWHRVYVTAAKRIHARGVA